MPSGPRLLLATLAACLACPWSPASATRASVLPEVTGVHSTAPVDSAFTDATALAGFGDAALSREGRKLTAFTAAAAVTNVGISVLEAFLGAGAGQIVNGLFGSSAVPIDLGALIDEAVAEIDRAVGERLDQAFNNEKRALLRSLVVRVREYVRRADLKESRSQVQDMLDAASELLALFEDSGVVMNGAFQTTLALRLSLLLELLQLDELIGEVDGVLLQVRASIRRQARTGKAALESWRASYSPETNGVKSFVFVPCTNSNPNRKCKESSRERTITVCMDMSSPGLKPPPAFCEKKKCSSRHVRAKIRRDRMRRCTSNFEKEFTVDIGRHVRDVALDQFRDRNEKAVFGAPFKQFLADLASVETFNFAGVVLPDVGAAAVDAAEEES